jgi:hypothetical protein
MAHITQQDFALAAEDLVFHAMHKINQVTALLRHHISSTARPCSALLSLF